MGCDTAREGEQDREAGLVAPVQILQDNKQRARSREMGDELHEDKDEAVLLPLGIERGGRDDSRQVPGEIRQERDKVGSDGTEITRDRVRWLPSEECAQHVEERRIREDAVGLETAAHEDKHVPRGFPRPHLRHETRLTDARLARDHNRPATAIAGSGEVGIEADEKWGAADDHGADYRRVDGRGHDA